ncbi:MAG: acyl-CoA dehydrogenase family protein [Chitinophagales bacterium]|jgi:alkylation response protein AidB-like acyl-CoA dehydrogenase|nr:acyl-CoA dehydrogenase family protein [Chitinophagales bacterium]
MNFARTENQDLIRQTVKSFAEKEVLPNYRKWDETQEFPREVFEKLGDLGLMGVLIDPKYNGAGMTYFEYVVAIEELAKVCGSVGLSYAAHNSLCSMHINMFGNEAQKEKYLTLLASGKFIGAWALTEPNTGSDAMRMQCVAKKNGNQYVINGNKNFITHGKSGDVVVVIARTGELLDSRGMTAFIVERNNPGLKAGKKEDKLGMRASETAEVIFDECVVDETAVLGEVGEGFIQAMKILDGGRISIAALSLGIAKGAYEAALKYSKERKQFGKAISEFQAISFKLADMATKIEAAELLIYQAADLKNRGQKVTKESAIAKLYASEISCEVANEAVQIMGGYGYIKDFPVEKHYRDCKLCTIGEGTSEIQKLVIARDILK